MLVRIVTSGKDIYYKGEVTEMEDAMAERLIKGGYVEAASKCPDCGAAVSHESGCRTCRMCGWSACS